VVLGTKLAYRSLCRTVEKAENLLKEREEVDEGYGFKFKPAIFYVCPQIFRTALVLAGFCLSPELDEKGMLEWLRRQRFSGEIGDISLLGRWRGYDIYVVGADGEPEIVSRILKEFGRMVDVPSLHWLVVRAPEVGNLPCLFFSKIFKICRFWKGVYLCEGLALRKMLGDLRKEACRLRILLSEGILD
ncbi:MAG: hypothetical protein ACPLTR_10330, partial [Thermacetogeniaceae bacterium]